MVEEALLLVVSVLLRAGLCLKEPQVKQSNTVLLARTTASCFLMNRVSFMGLLVYLTFLVGRAFVGLFRFVS